ncbi:MAG: LacI family DNA-binding transcriptional regulator [Anaerolineae bacterium]|nr:LacI family DNA-binding transcriptional regulator [Anaerolineae bacterium]
MSPRSRRDDKTVTQADVARHAGVSRAVVSYVINNGPRAVSEITRARVLRAIEELGYRPNKHAQGLKRQDETRARGQIGLILGGTSHILQRPYFSAMLAAFYQETHRRRQQIRFVTFFDELLDPVFFNQNLHPEQISGLVLFTPYMLRRDPAASALLRRIIDRLDNIVCLETVIADLPAVIFDRTAAASQIVSHLIGLGHTRIAFAGVADERLDGYRQTMTLHGLATEPELVIDNVVHNLPEEGYAAGRALLALPNPPTAVFCVCDEMAVGMLAAFQDAGVSVPEEMALGAIDNIELAGLVRPTLTTVHVPIASVATYALRILDMHAEYPDSQPASIVLPTRLVVRESCGAPPDLRQAYSGSSASR